MHPEDREPVLQAVANCLRTGAEYRSEYRVILPDGQLRWISGRGDVEFNGSGQPVRMRGASRTSSICHSAPSSVTPRLRSGSSRTARPILPRCGKCSMTS
jgi:hypothetical protein